ncbi:nicotinate (nicotinamide) nucleotide adenylyltransferase [Candidatus Fermentibacteria bacterium]|nr:nicotinate (nicotinamide) nucleotide adenylyltransferase [Candidatus Fermentibacteria bacterium]
MTGLLGGTFDPPHFGHLLLGEEARLRFGLERVIFVPSRNPPHKPGIALSPFEHRMAMLELAVLDNASFEAADLEAEAGSSYTCDLLELASSRFEGVVFLMGMDSLVEMPSWKNYPGLLDLARFAAGTRPGWSSAMAAPATLARVEIFEFPGLHVSSTELRERFARGGATRYLTPDAVRAHALRERLYGGAEGY